MCSCIRTIVYSGDCRPNRRLPKIGEWCDLLIHEATFDNELADDAVKKRHSTVDEAIGVAQDMKAGCCVLTHFSQRYPVMPVMPPQHDATGRCRLLCAWDYFTFCLVGELNSACEASYRTSSTLDQCAKLLSPDES